MFLERLGVGRRPPESDGRSLDPILGQVGPISCIYSRLLTTISSGLHLVLSCLLFFQLAGIFKLNYRMEGKQQSYTLSAWTHDPKHVSRSSAGQLGCQGSWANHLPISLSHLSPGLKRHDKFRLAP